MIRKSSIVFPLMGVAVLVLWMVSARPIKKGSPLVAPPVSPYTNVIAATGVIEASNRNYNLAPPLAGQLAAVYVKENDLVHRGDKLYLVDDREQRASLTTAQANVAKAEAALATLQTSIATQEANLESAKAAVASAKSSYENADQIARRTVGLFQAQLVSEQDYTTAVKTRDIEKAKWDQTLAQEHQAEAQLINARSQLREQEADLRSAKATRDQQAVLLEKLTVRAPADGKILQVNNRVGEYVSSTPASPPVVFGDTDFLLVRADVDEMNASQVRPDSEAIASLKGNSSLKFPLEFVRIVPYMVPKQNLTGSNTERVDVRVLQIEFRFKPPEFPVYVGQQVDVFIRSKE